MRVPAGGLDLGRGARQPVGVAVADGDVGAEARARDRDGRADALRRAGDDDEPVGEQRGRGRERHGRSRLAATTRRAA